MRAVWGLAFLAVACQSTPSKPPPDQIPAGVRAAVLQHHGSESREGVYVDSAMTREAVRHLRQDEAFSAPLAGGVHADPLYWDGGDGGQDLLIVATELNEVIAFDPITGARVWSRVLAPPVPKSATECGNIFPLGITGTPIIDATRKLLFLDAMTTPDKGATKAHLVYTLSVVDGSVIGTPVDLNTAVPGFDSTPHNQRGALALQEGVLYLPFGGNEGDCGGYSGWVIGIDTTGSRAPLSFKTGAPGGGIWATAGVAAKDGFLFVATGNTFLSAQWQGGEAILKLAPGPSFSWSPNDYYAPSQWRQYDDQDTDVGSSGALPFDAGGARLVAAMGKDGAIHIANRDNLGGVGGELLQRTLANRAIITAPAVISTPAGTFLGWTGSSSSCDGGRGLLAVRIDGGSPISVQSVWCAGMITRGAPIATTTGGGAEAIFWVAGAEGDGQLHAVSVETGAVLYAGGAMNVNRFNSPIVAKGRVYLAGVGGAWAFTVR